MIKLIMDIIDIQEGSIDEELCKNVAMDRAFKTQ
jgi:hypothetical protein